MGAKHSTLWNTDIKGGDEKAFCCINSNARDFARIGKLYMNFGNWNGRQIIDSNYVLQSTSVADLLDEDGNKMDQTFLGGLSFYEYGTPMSLTKTHNGGYIFVTTGALKLMRNEAQLAGVLAHELAHINQKHIVKQLNLQSTDRSMTSGIAQILGGATLSAKIALERLNDLAFKMLMEEGLSKKDEADANQVQALAPLNGFKGVQKLIKFKPWPH